jgi:two-component system, NtrC family, sensor histidine kinase HydH
MPRAAAGFRIPIRVQVGLVAALFVAALVVLWVTMASVVEREGRRSKARDLLENAGRQLVARGSEIMADAVRFPEFPDEQSREELDRRLTAAAKATLSRYNEGIEGGYLVLSFKSFLGTFLLKPDSNGKGPGRAAADPQHGAASGGSVLPPLEADLIDIQVDAAIRKGQVLFTVEELADRRPVTVAIRTEPVVIKGTVVGASWVMTRLIDPLFVDRSLQGYRLAAGLALGGIVVALTLTAGLARTVRKQAVERDRLQAELRRNERLAALGKLLAGVAHEVRNPLAGIRSTVQLWQRGVGLDDESFNGLVHEADRLQEIVTRLLQFSRADAQTLDPSDLNAVLAESARLAAGLAEAKGVRIEVDLDAQLPPVAMAPSAMLQVFRNLTSNAIDAMDSGGKLHLTSRRDPSGRAVVATVSDTGPGLTPDALQHLFEPFFTTKAEGTGLGLAIAREIALSHRGDLQAANREEGRGALFTLTLPAASPERNGGPHS